MIELKTRLAAAALLLGVGAAAHALDLWDEIRKRIQGPAQAPTETGKPQPKPKWESGIEEAARALLGFSREEEIAIGRQAAGNLLGAAPLVNDARLQKYVNQVGRWIATQSKRPDLVWYFGVIESNDINAFAAPGGYVLITKGLYRVLRTESELAGVLAHEIAHIVEKHHLKLLEQSRLLGRAGKVLTDRVGENEHIKNLIGNGAEIFSRALDQNAEYEADRMAMVLAARAGYDPFGLPTVLHDLGHVAGQDSRVRLLFRTHPHPDERLARLEDTAERLDSVRGNTNTRRFYRLRL